MISNSLGQDNKTLENIENELNKLYKSGNWNGLINLCDSAFQNGYDSYHLRQRAGIAFYVKHDYMSAACHFEKALEFEPFNPEILEYLYYSYLFSGRESDSQTLILSMPEYLIKKLKIKEIKPFFGVYTESGFSTNNLYSDKKKNAFKSTTNFYDEQKLNKNEFYYNFTLFNQLRRNIKIINAFNFINLNQVKQIKDYVNGLKNIDISTNQYEYYFNFSANLDKGFNVTAAIHYLHVNANDYNFSFDTTKSPFISNYKLVQSNYDNVILLLTLSKALGKFKINFTNTYSNLNDDTQYQNGLSLVYYPLGNLDLYLISDFILHSEREAGKSFISHGIVEPKIGFKINRYLWLEAYNTFGNIYNFNEINGFVAYNNDDVILNRFGFNIISPVIPYNLELSLRYQYYNQETSVISYVNSTNYNIKTITSPNHKLIGGIKWIF